MTSLGCIYVLVTVLGLALCSQIVGQREQSNIAFAAHRQTLVVRGGACDASAAARLTNQFFVIATDESTKAGKTLLHVYDFGDDTPSELSTADLTENLVVNPNDPLIHDEKDGESDIEAAARVGDRIYWISSHSHSKKGYFSPDRRRFFATDVHGAHITQVGKVYTKLLDDLIREDPLKGFTAKNRLDHDLASLARAGTKTEIKDKKASAGVLPEGGGLNIEGLAEWGNGGLLIGFRSPLVKGDGPAKNKNMALLIPLLNPSELVSESSNPVNARFGKPLELDLGGMGVRDITYWHEKKIYVILAGPAGPNIDPQLFLWTGIIGQQPQPVAVNWPEKFAAEAVITRGSQSLLVLSDDDDFYQFGANGKNNKDLEDSQRRFRSFELILEKK